MKNPIIAEVNILDRIMYLLEEDSVGHLAQHDTKFGQFVGQIYGAVQNKAEQLQQIES
jgi:hypothetical protein